MPHYLWKDKHTSKKVEIIRNFEQYQETPTREEASELTDEEYAAAEWERSIEGTFKVTKTVNWRRHGGKGDWA